MEAKLFNQSGDQVGTLDLNDKIFDVEYNEGLVFRALKYQRNNSRQGTAHSMTRGERRGSTRKIYRQKGTGRARMGSNRSPVRRKGGVVFGPRNTVNFTIKMNKKERRKALFVVLSSKFREGNIIFLDNLSFDKVSTKSMISVLSSLPINGKTLLSLPNKDNNVMKSVSNIPTSKSILVNYLNMADLLKYETLLLTKDSLKKIEEVFVK